MHGSIQFIRVIVKAPDEGEDRGDGGEKSGQHSLQVDSMGIEQPLPEVVFFEGERGVHTL